MVIKYRYAYNCNRFVDANNLERQNLSGKEVFKCVGCDNILIPVLGKKRQKHFRHKTEINCSFETYLHRLAKMTFYRVYQDCLQQNKPYSITINQTKVCNYYQQDFLVNCNFGIGNYTFNLTKYFSEVYLETRQDSFIPDLLLTNKRGDKLFVEIAVTHKASDHKRESEFRIIELNIANEDDLKIVENTNLKISEKVSFFNFKTELVGNFCQGKCRKELRPLSSCHVKYNCLILYNSGNDEIIETDLDGIAKLRKDKNIKYWEFITDPKYKYRVVRDCFSCRYHYQNRYPTLSITCLFLDKLCNSNEAINCSYFRPGKSVYPTRKTTN